jgi:hypothetical protein
MTKEEQKIFWPQATIFWGAGATGSLGMSQTAHQGEMIKALSQDNTHLKDRVKGVFYNNADEVTDLLIVLGDKLVSNLFTFTDEEFSAAQRLFAGVSEKELKEHIVYLREVYDWDALKRIIRIIPKCEEMGNLLRDLFNIIDMHIKTGQGFYVESDAQGEPYHIAHSRLVPARNCLVMLVNLSFYLSYQKLLNEEKKLEPYKEFCFALSKLMLEEGLEKSSNGWQLKDRDFYLFSYAVISMNFDPLFIWFLFNAHKELNNSPPNIGSPPQPMKLFHDFGIFMGVRDIDNMDWKVWYPFNETVVQRLNDIKYNSGRRARIGKFYFPHGCSCWRECRNCGKLTAQFGDEWSFHSRSLFPNPIIPGIGRAKPRTEKEKKVAGTRSDAIQCVYCGTLTFACDTPMIMQTSFKGDQPHYLEDVQRDLKVCLENTKHIVLMGYSLPSDDVIWRSILAARKSRDRANKVRCSVIVGYEGEDRWLSGKDLESFLEKYSSERPAKKAAVGYDAVISAKEIFGLENVRAYTGGIPQVWMRGGCVQTNISKILAWS